MDVVVGLGLGVGLLLIWSAFAVPTLARTKRAGGVQRLLAAAGLGGVSGPSFVILCGGCALVSLLAVQAISRTPTVALAFAVMGGYLPIVIVRSRARRRQRELAEVWPEAVDNLASARFSEVRPQCAHRG